MKIIAGLVAVVGVFVLIVALALLMAWPLMLLINYVFSTALLTFLFGAAKISFWKTVALSIVTGSLFKSASTSSSK